MNKNIFSISGIGVSDEAIRKLYDLPPGTDPNIGIIEEHRKEQLRLYPAQDEQINNYFDGQLNKILQSLANKGLLTN